jgi:hypothetical protein
MENQVNILESLIEKAKMFGITSIEIYKLKAIEKT